MLLDFTHPTTHPLSKLLLNIYYVSGTILGTGLSASNQKIGKISSLMELTFQQREVGGGEKISKKVMYLTVKVLWQKKNRMNTVDKCCKER